jgi:hypothetical protein
MALGCSAGKEKKRERRLNSGVLETGVKKLLDCPTAMHVAD